MRISDWSSDVCSSDLVIEAVIGDDPAHICGRSMHGQKPAVSDVRVQIIDEFLIGVDRNEHCVWSHPFQNRTAKGADAWAIFHEQLHILPINGLQHGTDHCRGGRNKERKMGGWGKSV